MGLWPHGNVSCIFLHTVVRPPHVQLMLPVVSGRLLLPTEFCGPCHGLNPAAPNWIAPVHIVHAPSTSGRIHRLSCRQPQPLNPLWLHASSSSVPPFLHHLLVVRLGDALSLPPPPTQLATSPPALHEAPASSRPLLQAAAVSSSSGPRTYVRSLSSPTLLLHVRLQVFPC
jgi:hypothetical protein